MWRGVDAVLCCSFGWSLLGVAGGARSSVCMSGALASISRRYVLDPTRLFGLGALACCSPVAGVAAMEELGPSGIVDAEPCKPDRSITRLWGTGVMSGDSGRDIAERCRWSWL